MTTLDQYTDICKRIGKDQLPICGFITPRAIGNTTFIYGDLTAKFIPALTDDSIVFYRYMESLDKYELEESERIPLPNAVGSSAKIVHFDSIVEEKNVFSLSFAVISNDSGNLRVDIVRKEKSFNLLADVIQAIGKARETGVVHAYELKNEVQNATTTCHFGQCSYKFGIPYSSDYGVYGGNGTIILHDKTKKEIYKLIMSDGVFKVKNYKFDLSSKNPIVEIVAKGLFTVIDDNMVILSDEKLTKFDLKQYNIDNSQLLYELIKLKDGANANLLLYSNKTNDALLFITDPTENDFGKAGKFSF